MIAIIIGAAALGSAAIGSLAGAAGKADMDLAKEIGNHANPHHLIEGANLAGSASQILSFFPYALVVNKTILHFEKFIDFGGERAMRYVRQHKNNGFRRF